MKTKVRIINTDVQNGDYVRGEYGYIDGYVRGGNDTPFIVVVIGKKIVLCRFHDVEVVEYANFD